MPSSLIGGIKLYPSLLFKQNIGNCSRQDGVTRLICSCMPIAKAMVVTVLYSDPGMIKDNEAILASLVL